MELEYCFPESPELRQTKIRVAYRNGRIRARLRGHYTLRAWLLTMFYFTYFNRIKPLAVHEGGRVMSLYLPPMPSGAHARMMASFLSAALFDRLIPQAATIGVTSACQYDCVHCSAKGRSNAMADMTLDELKRTARQCIQLGICNLTFTGGEPLLRRDLEELVASVPKAQAITLVFTNAALLTPQRARTLRAAGLFGVHISLDAADPAEHDRLRGVKGAFEAVRRGVRNALDAGLLVGISTYATRQSALQHAIWPIAGHCAQWGVHELTVFDAIQTGILKDQSGIGLDQNARKTLLADSQKINRRFKGRLRVVTQTWTNTGRGFSRFIGCLAANLQLHVTAQGEFTPCDFTPLTFGNIRRESVRELWQKMLQHPAYCQRSIACRMQNADFRKKYIETIPQEADLPYPIFRL
jgi:MoaA/NifB/PqqE/SkfB family radical SAM enzyme